MRHAELSEAPDLMMSSRLQIDANRKARKYPPRIQAARVLWAVGRVLFRVIPRPLHVLRIPLLRLFGARIGRNVHISNSAIIYFPWELVVGDESAIGDWAYVYNLAELRIGRRVTISQRAHLCGGTHDYRDPGMPLVRCPIEVGDDAWICADAFVGPGVAVGAGAIIGARAVVMKDVEAWQIVVGNPARVVRKRVLNERASDV